MLDIFEADNGALFLIGGNHRVIDIFGSNFKPSKLSLNNFKCNIRNRLKTCKKKRVPIKNYVFPEKLVWGDSFHSFQVQSLYLEHYHKLLRDANSSTYLLDSINKTNKAFLQTDTHFSLEGIVEAVCEINKNLPVEFLEDYRQNVKNKSKSEQLCSGDLGRKFSPEKTEFKTNYVKPSGIQLFSNGMVSGNDGIMILTHNTDAKINKKLLIFGDSFFRSLLPHLSFFYSEIIFCRTRYFHTEIFELFSPDVVFTGGAERYLSFCDSDSNAPLFFSYPLIKGKQLKPENGFSDLYSQFTKKM